MNRSTMAIACCFAQSVLLEPLWILQKLPTRHRIKLEAELYQELEKIFKHSRSPKKTSAKQVETLMDESIN